MTTAIMLALLAVTAGEGLLASALEARRLKQAELKGSELLLENLSSRQRQQYRELGYLDVIGSESGHRYRIYYGKARNVRRLNSGDWPDVGLCFTPEGDLATGDRMLAQKIALENCEPEVLEVALRF
jgi:hypothetical protein